MTILTFIYKKIQSHNNEPTTIQIKSLQSFLRTQLQRNEITKAQFDLMKQKMQNKPEQKSIKNF